MPQRPRGALGQRRAACWCCCWPSRWIIVGLLRFRAQQLAIMASVCDLGRTTWCLAERWGKFLRPYFRRWGCPGARHCSTHFSSRGVCPTVGARARDQAEQVPPLLACPGRRRLTTATPRTQALRGQGFTHGTWTRMLVRHATLGRGEGLGGFTSDLLLDIANSSVAWQSNTSVIAARASLGPADLVPVQNTSGGSLLPD